MSLDLQTTKDYEILERLGQGLSSDIYKGIRKDTTSSFKQLVTIKVYKSKDFRKKFQNELKNLSRIQCEGIPRVLDWNANESQAVIFMEYIEGVDLEMFLEANKAHLDIEVQRYIVSSIYSSLSVLQENGMCHGDLKPSNVIVSIEGKIKLIDICLDDHGFVYATPDFAAPEVLLGHRPDHKSDLYSLGLIAEALGSRDFRNLTEVKAGRREFVPIKRISKDKAESTLSKLVWKQKYGVAEAIVRNKTSEKTASATTSTMNLADLKSPETQEMHLQSRNYNSLKTNRNKIFNHAINTITVLLLLITFMSLSSLKTISFPQISTVKLRSLNAWEVFDKGQWHNLPYNYTSSVLDSRLNIPIRRKDLNKIMQVNVAPYEQNKIITIDAH